MTLIRRTFKIVGVFLVAVILVISSLIGYILIDLHPPPPVTATESNVVNDITLLNPIKVHSVLQPTSIEQISQAIMQSKGPISIGGGRFSQGGQTAFPESVHLDMRNFNQVVLLDEKKQQVTVQSGITWRDLQEVIDHSDLSIKIMQTYANFTVGGSLSVNAHGRYVGEGPIIKSVDSMRLVLANGSIVDATPTKNSELFYGAIGGYGGLAVIAQVTLNLESNVKVKRQTLKMDLTEYADFFAQSINNNSEIVFHNADIYPPNFTHINAVSWFKTDEDLTEPLRLVPKDKVYSWQPKVAEFVADSDFGKWLREYVMEPTLYLFDVVQWRNFEASYDVRELEPSSRVNTTYALREYFVPEQNFNTFSQKMISIFKKYDCNIINVSIRHANADPGTLLVWASTDVFAFVVYYRQDTDKQAQQKVTLWSQELIDAVLSEQGTYYLPYQLSGSKEQFIAAYPRAIEFFALKQKIDPNNRFSNALWQKYYSPDTSM
jgi:FAD/FMN-containing dehydrogenase